MICAQPRKQPANGAKPLESRGEMLSARFGVLEAIANSSMKSRVAPAEGLPMEPRVNKATGSSQTIYASVVSRRVRSEN
jgi:hypothetical protein